MIILLKLLIWLVTCCIVRHRNRVYHKTEQEYHKKQKQEFDEYTTAMYKNALTGWKQCQEEIKRVQSNYIKISTELRNISLPLVDIIISCDPTFPPTEDEKQQLYDLCPEIRNKKFVDYPSFILALTSVPVHMLQHISNLRWVGYITHLIHFHYHIT